MCVCVYISPNLKDPWPPMCIHAAPPGPQRTWTPRKCGCLIDTSVTFPWVRASKASKAGFTGNSGGLLQMGEVISKKKILADL